MSIEEGRETAIAAIAAGRAPGEKGLSRESYLEPVTITLPLIDLMTTALSLIHDHPSVGEVAGPYHHELCEWFYAQGDSVLVERLAKERDDQAR